MALYVKYTKVKPENSIVMPFIIISLFTSPLSVLYRCNVILFIEYKAFVNKNIEPNIEPERRIVFSNEFNII